MLVFAISSLISSLSEYLTSQSGNHQVKRWVCSSKLVIEIIRLNWWLQLH